MISTYLQHISFVRANVISAPVGFVKWIGPDRQPGDFILYEES
jgi:hypothetical protein